MTSALAPPLEAPVPPDDKDSKRKYALIVIIVLLIVGAGVFIFILLSSNEESHPNAADIARQQVCFANVPALFYDDRGNCYSVDPTNLSEAERQAVLVVPTAAGAPPAAAAGGQTQAPAAPGSPAPVAPVAPGGEAASPPASGPTAPGASPDASTPAPAAPAAPAVNPGATTPPVRVTVDDGRKHEWKLRLNNAPAGYDQPISLTFGIANGVADGTGSDPNLETDNRTFNEASEPITDTGPAKLSIIFSKAGTTRSGISTNGTFTQSPANGTASMSGTYRFSDASTGKTTEGTFTLTMN